MSETPPPVPPFAYSFDSGSWRQRSAWRQTRIRGLERIDQSLRIALESFGERQRPLDAVVAELDRMERWIAQVRNECTGIEAVRVINAATPEI